MWCGLTPFGQCSTLRNDPQNCFLHTSFYHYRYLVREDLLGFEIIVLQKILQYDTLTSSHMAHIHTAKKMRHIHHSVADPG